MLQIFDFFDSLLAWFRGAAVPLVRLILLQVLADSPFKFNNHKLPDLQYDFVIVGGGTAGSIMAARLAETHARVLVLEAGSSAPPETSVPGLMPLTLGSDVDYHIKLNTPGHLQQAFQDSSSFLNIGRTMGGGSSINGLVYCRGHKLDYDNWALQGNPGWDYDSVLPYFKKSVNYRGIVNPNTERYHGFRGPVSLEAAAFNSTTAEAYFKAARELGYDVVEEIAPRRSGFVLQINTIGNGVRQSTSETFLRPIINKNNLFVLTGATVTKIIIDSRNRAVGVEYFFRGKVTIHY
ncbi:Glucose-methanol-choline oxidoreductase N-terminal [Trinorchestia longiramus]|nr:Glucose-methanol-choline oxidoreductase N-terminal [Trinorchestia longiramus]